MLSFLIIYNEFDNGMKLYHLMATDTQAALLMECHGNYVNLEGCGPELATTILGLRDWPGTELIYDDQDGATSVIKSRHFDHIIITGQIP